MSLEQDYTVVPGQLYACLSIVGPEAPQKNDKFGIKIRGAFSTRDEAANHAKRLQKEDATFDIYVVDLYKWLLIPPDPSKIEDSHYTNDKLEELMKGYKENQAMAAKMFNDRKSDMQVDKDKDGKPLFYKAGDENSKYYNKPDEAPISHPAEIIERLQREKPSTSMEELVKEADAIVLDEIEKRRKQRENELSAIEENDKNSDDVDTTDKK
tara:strand:- start:5022 stop:5654 length:633 start_codon:yes stop_codon:yes gene_type:complete